MINDELIHDNRPHRVDAHGFHIVSPRGVGDRHSTAATTCFSTHDLGTLEAGHVPDVIIESRGGWVAVIDWNQWKPLLIVADHVAVLKCVIKFNV